MTRNQKVLIVGAGASHDLHQGFALGHELTRQISERVTDITSLQKRNLSDLLQKHLNFDPVICSDFVNYLNHYIQYSQDKSIDEFLNEVASYPEFRNQASDFIKIGKFAIMFHILGYESELLKVQDSKKTWIDEVASYIQDTSILENKPNGPKLKIITFNYDRTIEHLLFNHPLFKTSQNEIINYINTSVIHVYGKVGNLPWESDQEVFEFGEPNNKAQKIFLQKNNISLMYPERGHTKDPRHSELYDVVHDTNNKYVGAMGFNFNLLNYRLLGIQDLGLNDRVVQFIANVYPCNDNTFKPRRDMASRIRAIKHNTQITYLSCQDFVKHVLIELD